MSASRSRWRHVLVVLIVSVLVAASCGDDDTDGESAPSPEEGGATDSTAVEDEDAGDPVYGGSIVIGLEAESAGWTPGQSTFGTAGPTVASAIYDPLVVVSGEGEFEPYLAESLEPDAELLQWTLTLRPDVVFHDGTPFDAEALKWNFDTLHNSEGSLTRGTITSAGVTSMEVVDELTVVYTLSEPNAAFPDLLTSAVGWPVSPTAYEAAGADEFDRQPVGTGPFVAGRWLPDDEFPVTRNENYWRTDEDGNQLPYLDEITFRPIPDEESRVNSLLADSAQIVHSSRGYAGKNLIAAAEDGGYEANVAIGNTSGTSIFNFLEPPVDDIRVRTAMALASNADEIAEVLGDDGLSPRSTQFVSIDSPWYSTAAEEAYVGAEGQDLERATELIQEYMDDPERSDGEPVGTRLTVRYQCPPDPSLLQVAQVLQAYWQQIGVDLDITQVEQPVLISNVVGSADTEPAWRGDYEVSCWRTGATGDPYTTLSSYFGPPESTPGNVLNWSDPAIDTALESLRTSPEFADRYDANEEINVIANENVAIVWNIGTPSTTGWRNDLHGIVGWTLPSGAEGTGTLNNRIWTHQIWMEG
jgi:peptide/nickel transport system substrate-binding protein